MKAMQLSNMDGIGRKNSHTLPAARFHDHFLQFLLLSFTTLHLCFPSAPARYDRGYIPEPSAVPVAAAARAAIQPQFPHLPLRRHTASPAPSGQPPAPSGGAPADLGYRRLGCRLLRHTYVLTDHLVSRCRPSEPRGCRPWTRRTRRSFQTSRVVNWQAKRFLQVAHG